MQELLNAIYVSSLQQQNKFTFMIKRIQTIVPKILYQQLKKQQLFHTNLHIIKKNHMLVSYFPSLSTLSFTRPVKFSLSNQKSIIVDYHQYQFSLLHQREIEKALQLTIEILVKEGPLNKARFEKHWSAVAPQKMEKYLNFYQAYLKNSVKRRLAQGIFYNKELIGVSVSQDISFAPPDFSSLYSQAYDLLKYDMAILDKLSDKTPSMIKFLMGKQNQIMDMGNTVIKQQHRGRGLLYNLIDQIEKTAIQQNFKYIFVCSTNCRVSRALKKREFIQVCRIDCKDIEIGQERPFENIDEDNRWPSFWLRIINQKS